MINVTKTYLPPQEEYAKYLDYIWSTGWVTNRGTLVCELEKKLESYLEVNHFLYVNNGTTALQLAIKALDLKGEIITTPFSYVATVNSIIWEGYQPVFVDIEPDFFCINPTLIEDKITKNTSAILATHVYGNPCDVEAIERIAKKHNLRVIYDAAHAFGVQYKGKSLLSYGDVSTLSLHATKIFHTIEGGGVITSNKGLHEKLLYLHAFGHQYDDYKYCGINGKNSEFHAAIGHTIFPMADEFIAKRKIIFDQYNELLSSLPIQLYKFREGTVSNFSYYPILFEDEATLLAVLAQLNKQKIYPRRYFWPSLNGLSFLKYQKMPVSEDIAKRILCLPSFYELTENDVEKVSSVIRDFFLQNHKIFL